MSLYGSKRRWGGAGRRAPANGWAWPSPLAIEADGPNGKKIPGQRLGVAMPPAPAWGTDFRVFQLLGDCHEEGGDQAQAAFGGGEDGEQRREAGALDEDGVVEQERDGLWQAIQPPGEDRVEKFVRQNQFDRQIVALPITTPP